MSEENQDFTKKAEEMLERAAQNVPDFMKTGEQDQMLAAATQMGRFAASFYKGTLQEGLSEDQAATITLHFLLTQMRGVQDDASE